MIDPYLEAVDSYIADRHNTLVVTLEKENAAQRELCEKQYRLMDECEKRLSHSEWLIVQETFNLLLTKAGVEGLYLYTQGIKDGIAAENFLGENFLNHWYASYAPNGLPNYLERPNTL